MKSRLLAVGFPSLIAIALTACSQPSEVQAPETTSSESTSSESTTTEQPASPSTSTESASGEPAENTAASPSKPATPTASQPATTPKPATQKPSPSPPELAPRSEWGYSIELAYYNKTSGAVNLRTGPSEDASVKGTLAVNDGGYIKACSTKPGWCQIESFDSEMGWVYMPLLAGLPDPEAFEAAHPKGNARCVIKGVGGVVDFDGSCNFKQSGGNGSFSIESPSGLIAGRLMISVSILQPGVADVRGMTTDLYNARWGEAKRSASDPACWVGSDFEVCAY